MARVLPGRRAKPAEHTGRVPGKMPAVSRTSLILGPVLLLGICAVLGGAWVLIERDRTILSEQFATDRSRQVADTARQVTSELEDIAEDLRFGSELLAAPGSPSDHERELRALLQVVAQYKAISVVSQDGTSDLWIVDRTVEKPRARQWEQLMRQTALTALLAPPAGGVVHASPALKDESWERAFAVALPIREGQPHRALAVLVDLEPYFGGLKLITADSDAHLIVLGAHGRPTPATDPRLADRIRDQGRLDGTLAGLVAQMRAGAHGTLRLPAEEAQASGLGSAEVIAAFAPIRPAGGGNWSVATLTSLSSLRAAEEAVAVRLGGAAALVALLLLAFGGYAVITAGRAVVLREQERHAARLAHLHEKAQKILDNIPTGVLALHRDGRIGAVNRALSDRVTSARTGATLEEAFPDAPPAEVHRIRTLVGAAQVTGRVLSLPLQDLPLFGAPGHFNLHVVPLEHADPDVHALVVIDDLSNVHALQSQLLRAEKLATVGVLAAGIAHEIGTPLGVARGRAEYLLGKLPADAPHRSGLEVIVGEIDRVSRTIRQLLDFSRMQAPQVRRVVLSQVCAAVADLLSMEALRRSVTLTFDVPAELPPLSADPDQLHQALVNLLMNAFDASKPGGHIVVRGRFVSTEPETTGHVVIEVVDEGCGILPERLNQIFDPFFTTKKRGQGTGLGLTLVAQITRNHGGKVELESRPEEGTRVMLQWPIAVQEERRAVS